MAAKEAVTIMELVMAAVKMQWALSSGGSNNSRDDSGSDSDGGGGGGGGESK